MTKVIFILAFFILNITMHGCSSSSSEANFTFGIGNYKFSMSDSLGSKLLEGTLNVKTYSNNKISGTYKYSKVYNSEFDGYSTMDGEFEGDINSSEKIVFINTNPKIADSNVFWRMRIRKDGLSGGWIYSAFRGTTSGGFVKVTKK